MDYLKEKYTKDYFLKEDSHGNYVNIGAEGAELFKKGEGRIREMDENILYRINFNGKNVLEFGYGRGEAIKYALDRGAKKVVGVDFSKDAYSLAKEYLKRNNLTAELYCDDVLRFLKSDNIHNKFDIVIMLDFVEHVPRNELAKSMNILNNYLTNKAIIVINTPVYKVDNDVITEGLTKKNYDTSDEHHKTEGMHCNRYTKKSLKDFMHKFGYNSISGHFYSNNLQIPFSIQGKKSAFKLALEAGYPIIVSERKEIYEYAYSTRDFRVKIRKIISFFRRIVKITVKNLIPPIILLLLKLLLKGNINKKRPSYNPTWHTIKNGILRDKKIFLDSKDGCWQEMIEGTYDDFFFKYLKDFVLNGLTIFDIGSHIGYHLMAFSVLVGEKGDVIGFEPNPFSLSRINKNLSENKCFTNVTIQNYAVSDISGICEFIYHKNIEYGYSSGSHINKANTPSDNQLYDSLGFEKKNVNSITLDDFLNDSKFPLPDIIKLDIEGAEHLALKGMNNLLKTKKPIVLIEVHSILNMLKICEYFTLLKYTISLLKEEKDGRCFIAAQPLT